MATRARRSRARGTSCWTSDGNATAPRRRADGQLTRSASPSCRHARTSAELDILTMGITFTVYADGRGIDRAWPFDIIPRVIDAAEWRRIERGPRAAPASRSTSSSTTSTTTSRSSRDGVFPAELLDDSVNFRPECRGVRPKFGVVGAHLAAATSCATPTARCTCSRTTCACRRGVSYMLENRADLEAGVRRPVRPPEHPAGRRVHRRAQRLLVSLAPDGVARPDDRRAHARASTTPPTSSTRSSPSGWASSSSRARDLVVGDDDCVYMRTIDGLRARSTSSTGASTTCSSTRRCSGPTRRSASPA